MIKTALIIIAIIICPGIIMGLISSYRAGQNPHKAVYLRIKKFTQQKKKG